METKKDDPRLLYRQLIRKMGKHFSMRDFVPVDVAIATYIANHFDSDPLWLLINAPPSNAKTEIIVAMSGLEDIHPLSTLTEQTLLSGWQDGKQSLIFQLDKKILTMKDFTTVLSMRRESRSVILSQLREIYDGRIRKTFGTGVDVNWEGKVGFIAGVTPAIDRYYSVLQVLGERFIQVRMEQADGITMAKKAIRAVGGERTFRKEIRDLMTECCRSFVRSLGEIPKISKWFEDKLATLATVCVTARSTVERDRYKREVIFPPQPEAPPRFAKQLSLLAQGLAARSGKTRVTDDEYQVVFRVALDSLPVANAGVVRLLCQRESIGERDVEEDLSLSKSATFRLLEDLTCLGLLKQEPGPPTKWSLRENIRRQVNRMLPRSVRGYRI